MQYTLSSLTAKLLAVVAVTGAVALVAQSLPASAAVSSVPSVLVGATAPSTGTAALALGAVAWQPAEVAQVRIPALSAAGRQSLERVGAELKNANYGEVQAAGQVDQADGELLVGYAQLVDADNQEG